jgi:hypothetical protein
MKLFGGKMGRGRKEPSPSLYIGHQGLDLPSPSFSFSLKGGFKLLKLFFSSNIILNLILRILVPTSFLKKKRTIKLVVGKGKESRMEIL